MSTAPAPGSLRRHFWARLAGRIDARRVGQSAAWYSACLLLSLALAGLLLTPWRGEKNIPWFYATGDGTAAQTAFEAVIENGSPTQNPRLGAPFLQDLRGYPNGDFVHVAVVRILSWFTGDWALLFNAYTALMFPFIALAGMYAARQLGASWELSAACGVLYAFLPYHIVRLPFHVFLVSYWCVPLTVLVAVRLALNHRLTRSDPAPRWKRLSSDGAFAVVVTVVMAGCGIYYAVFGGMFYLVAGLYAAARQRSLRPILRAGLLLFILGAVMACAIIPSFLHSRGQVVAAQPYLRSPAEAELYGFRISQLVLPIPGHHLAFLARIRSAFDGTALMVAPNENAAGLGAIGAVGFFVLLACLVFPMLRSERYPFAPLGPLASMNIVAVMLATMGGFSSLIAFFLTPSIRAYNRIIVYIAFFCLLATALIMSEVRRRWFSGIWKVLLFGFGTGVFVLLGVWDQKPAGPALAHTATMIAFQRDANFVDRLEAAVPKGSMIFQLPYVPFPETPPVNRMIDYDLFRGFLHSKTLRWSYGAPRGSYEDFWEWAMARKPLPELVEALALANFAGVYVDRYGYKDPQKEIDDSLGAILGPPIDSEDHRLAFYRLAPAAEKLRSAYPPERLQARREAVLHPVLIQWRGAFSGLEGNEAFNWRWSGYAGQLALEHRGNTARTVTLDMDLVAAAGQADLYVAGPGFHDVLTIGPSPRHWSRQIAVPHGGCVLRFECNGTPLSAPGDPRILVFRVQNSRTTGIDPNGVVVIN